MAEYIISSGNSSNGIILANDSMTVLDGGVQFIPDMKGVPTQIIYLDFDGELTRYRNADLNLEIDNVQVEDSRLTPERIAGIVASLNAQFAGQNVLFTSERPKDTAYSTIFIGKTSAFNQYGSFAGLAETVDLDNRIKNDNAFVLLDASNSDSEIVSTIAHEAGHLLGTLDHGGDFLAHYAKDEGNQKNPGYIYYYYVNNCTLNGISAGAVSLYHYDTDKSIVSSCYQSDGGDSHVCIGSRYDKAIMVSLAAAASMNIGPDCSANNTIVSGGSMVVGGVAINTTILGGNMYVASEGTVNNTLLTGNYISMFVSGIANGTTLSGSRTSMYVGSGGTANNTTGGIICVSSGGTANNTTAGGVYVSNGGVANNTIGDGWISILSGGIANHVTVRYIDVYGGVANSATVSSGGSMTIDSKGMANNVTIKSGGTLQISRGAVTNLTLDEGAEINGFLLAEAQSLDEFNISNVTVSEYAYLNSNQTANNTMLTGIGASIRVLGGTIKGAVVNCKEGNSFWTGLNVDSGGKVYHVTIDFGTMYVSSYGTANNTIVNSGGSLRVYYGGMVDNTTVNIGGSMYVDSCGTADKTTVNSGGSVYIGGVANNAIINSGGRMGVGGVASEIAVSSGGSFTVFCGATTNNTAINSGGSMLVSSGGTATGVAAEYGAGLYLNVAPATYVQGTYGGVDFVLQDAFLSDFIIDKNAVIAINNDGSANSISVGSGGRLFALNGGIADNATVTSGGRFYLSSGGTANNIQIESGAYLGLYECTLRGEIVLGGQAKISPDVIDVDAEGANITFAINKRSSANGAIIDNISAINGAQYSISVNALQRPDTYLLAGGADDFRENISVLVDEQEVGEFIWNDESRAYNTVLVGDETYTLSRQYGNLLLDVQASEAISITITPEELGQVYFAEKDGRTYFAMDYVFSADITFFGKLSDGSYQYKAALNGSDGEVDFNFTVTNGSITYVSAGKSISSDDIVLNEDGSWTWHLEHVVDTLYIDQFESDSVELAVGGTDQNSGGTPTSTAETIKATACVGSYTDANKHYGVSKVIPIEFNHEGTAYRLNIAVSAILDSANNDYPFAYKANLSKLGENNQATLFESDLKVQLTDMSEMKTCTLKISGSSLGDFIIRNDNGNCSLTLKSTSEQLVSGENWVSWYYAIPELNACWIATGVNMLYRAGAFSIGIGEKSAQEIYELLAKKYYSKYKKYGFTNGILPKGGNVIYVLESFLDKTKSQKSRYVWYSLTPSNMSSFEEWKKLLHSNNQWCVSSLNIRGEKIGHVITVYDIVDNNDGTYTLICADSDHDLDSPQIEARILRIKNDGSAFEVQTAGGYKDVVGSHLLTARNIIPKDPISVERLVVAYGYNTLVYGNVNGLQNNNSYHDTLISNGWADELIVQADCSLLVESSATVGSLYVQSGASATLNEGANIDVLLEVTGRVDVNGLVNVKEVQFTLFETEPNSVAMISNLAYCGNADMNITVCDEQESGIYILADGASDFNGSITLCNLGIKLGTLAVGESLKVDGIEYALNLDESQSLVLSIAEGSETDTNVPIVLAVQADITSPTNGDVLVTATFSTDSEIKQYSLDGENWATYAGGVLFASNRKAYFRSIDAVGNISEVAEYEVTNIDRTAPNKPVVSANVTTPTNRSVTISAKFDEDTSTKEYSFDGEEWLKYTDAILCAKNETVSFRGIDAAGNVSEVVSLEVNNIDTEAPSDPAGLKAYVVDQSVVLVWNVSTDNFGVKEYAVKYTLEGQVYTGRTGGTSYVLSNADAGSYSWSVQAVDFAGNESGITAGDAFTVSDTKPSTVEYSADNFEHVIRFTVSSPTLDSFRMPTGTYQLRVRQEGSNEWMTGDSIVAAEFDSTPQIIKSDADGNADVFFANPVGTWESCYVAQHVGSINDWGGTNEFASVFGKNKLADIIEGSTDANILLMTDDDNGDTLFVDDIYTASPGNMAEQQARIAQIDEIRAGAGNDIVDMTSQQFEYIGDGLTIRGGEGNDTIWANKGNNWLFGDAGNDRIVGASGDDVIVGGIGNDRMHGGGGNDVFTFCDNWGLDNVEQLATGSVTLWFAEGSKDNWDEATLTYADGDNSVKVSGVAAEKVTLKFGDDGSAQFASLTSMGAFFDATTERIFEESGKGILASL